MPIPDIAKIEQWTLRNCLDERWGKDNVDFDLVDIEARLDPSARELTACPAFYWEHNDCHFAILKTRDKAFRCQFFYGNREQFGSGVHEYDDLGDCAIELLRLQADHESTHSGVFIESPRAESQRDQNQVEIKS